MTSTPSNLDMETAIIGRFLMGGTSGQAAIAEARSVGFQPWHLHHPAHIELCTEIFAAANEGSIDVLMIADRFKSRGDATLSDVITLTNFVDHGIAAANIARYASTLMELATARATVQAHLDSANGIMAGEVTPEQSLAVVQRAVESGIVKKSTTIKEFTERGFRNLVALSKSNGVPTGVPSGFIDIDRMTGGFKSDDLIIIAARPSMGKTAFILNITANAGLPKRAHMHKPIEERPKPIPTLFFSLEMSGEQLTERLLCSEAGVPKKRLQDGMIETDWNEIVAAAERIVISPLSIEDQGGLTLEALKAKARIWRSNRKIFSGDKDEKGLIVLDYLQLMRGDRSKGSSREQEISEISRGLKELAKELKVPVVALSQLNRAVDSRPDHRPVMGDLRESGAIEQDADVIMFIYRSERYLSHDASDEERRNADGKTEIIFAKQRGGDVGTVRLQFNKGIVRFQDFEGYRAEP
jgi:replicative DNA helicase